jgi:RsiW-degrading membrane proteinase PrsW (M82 family)
VTVTVWIYVWVFYSVPLVFMTVFVPVPCFYGKVYFKEFGERDNILIRNSLLRNNV